MLKPADSDPASAVVHWDRQWGTRGERERWLTPEAEVTFALEELRARGGTQALDLGCGVGRHALLMARQGLRTSALDGSPTGLDYLRAEAAAAAVEIDLQQGDACSLPYDENTFDYVLAWNVIYHGSTLQARSAVAEITRVLRPRGLFHGTILSKANIHYGRGREIAPDTFIDPTGTDKKHPHSYYGAEDLVTLFAEYQILRLTHEEHDTYAGAFHWHLLAERPTD